MTTQQTTASDQTDVFEQPAAPEQVFFEITTVDGAKYRKGEPAPYGTVTTSNGANVRLTVESFEFNGDWTDIELSGGYTLSLPEARIAHVVTRTV